MRRGLEKVLASRIGLFLFLIFYKKKYYIVGEVRSWIPPHNSNWQLVSGVSSNNDTSLFIFLMFFSFFKDLLWRAERLDRFSARTARRRQLSKESDVIFLSAASRSRLFLPNAFFDVTFSENHSQIFIFVMDSQRSHGGQTSVGGFIKNWFYKTDY